MTRLVRKIMCVAAVAVGLAFSGGAMDVTAGPHQLSNHLECFDAGGSTAVAKVGSTRSVTIMENRYGAGFLPE